MSECQSGSDLKQADGALQRFEVHVLEGPDAQVKTVSVLVDVSQKQNKAYRGGYKDKQNGTLYHHADCQTDRQVRLLHRNQSSLSVCNVCKSMASQAEIWGTECRSADVGVLSY
jgi:hypothetical protein